MIFAILEKSQNLVLAKIKIAKFNSRYTYTYPQNKELQAFSFSFSSLTLKNLRNHLNWKLSWTPSHRLLTLSNTFFKWLMVSIISLNTSRYKRVYHSALQAIAKHGSCLTGATLIEIGVYIFTVVVLLRLTIFLISFCEGPEHKTVIILSFFWTWNSRRNSPTSDKLNQVK